MCKLFIATGPLNKTQVSSVIRFGNELFSRTEKDGFGFLACADGEIARGRYEDPHRYPGFDSKLDSWLLGAQDEEGEIPEATTSLIVHGRTSTNVGGLEGCHPFEYGGHYLAHNGMVNYTGNGPDPVGDVDSDQFLHWLVDNNLEWDDAFANFAGCGAIGVYDSSRNILTVARDSASLFIARRENDEGWVMATCKEQLEIICRLAEIKLSTLPIPMPTHIVTFKDGKMVSERNWVGFASRATTKNDWKARGGKKRKVYNNSGPVTHGQYKLNPVVIPGVIQIEDKKDEPSESFFPGHISAQNYNGSDAVDYCG